MGAGRIVGGILALAAGWLVLFGWFMWVSNYGMPIGHQISLWNLLCIALAIVGGILGLVGNASKVGGGLVLAAGALWLITSIIWYISGDYFLMVPTSGMFFLMGASIAFLYFFAIESIIAVVAGIVLLVSPSD